MYGCDCCQFSYICIVCKSLLKINGYVFQGDSTILLNLGGALYSEDGTPIPKFNPSIKNSKQPTTNKKKEKITMGMSVTFTKEDLLKSTNLQAAWYRFRVKEITKKPGTSDPTSFTYHIMSVICAGTSNGVPVTIYISEKQPDKLSSFLKAFIERIEPGVSYEVDMAKDKEFEGYALYDDKMRWNTIESFRRVA